MQASGLQEMGLLMHKIILGIDENGLGPLLGPLVITGTLISYHENTTNWFKDITDSKEFFKVRTKSKFEVLEETVISLFYLIKERMPTSPLEIFESFCLPYKCSSDINICTNKLPTEFLWADTEKSKKRCTDFSSWADKNNLKLQSINSIFVCPKEINSFTKENTKLFLDFLSFCNIIKRANYKDNLEVFAGKIGGLKFYYPYLKYVMKDYEIKIITETMEESIYILSKEGASIRLGFFMNVEKLSFPAALSSIVGKYIRELSMFSIRQHLGIKEDVSGNHDKKTKRNVCIIYFRKVPKE